MRASGHPPIQVSFEFFPPRTEKMHENLWAAIERLAPLRPRFVSVTYGAGGSTRDRTHETVVRIQREKNLAAAAHLTCVGASRAEVDAVARHYWESGIRHVVALRGDPPDGQAVYTPHPQGYAFAADLVAGLKRVADFEISVAAYPETHPEARSPADDLDNLKRKIDAGASRSITNFFFDNGAYLRFRDRAAAAGVTVPIVPGVMPVVNFEQSAKFAAKNGVSVPAAMFEIFAGLENDAETRKLVAATVLADQVQALVREGVGEFHFYTLNRADLTFAVCHILGIRPHAPGPSPR
ncbi:MAG: methylenetetrahydrofolate reductase [Rhodospirillaceae bacterium]|nr:methylenetetrahydrofolate reductase [Rhodospirillaceae bacterium]